MKPMVKVTCVICSIVLLGCIAEYGAAAITAAMATFFITIAFAEQRFKNISLKNECDAAASVMRASANIFCDECEKFNPEGTPMSINEIVYLMKITQEKTGNFFAKRILDRAEGKI